MQQLLGAMHGNQAAMDGFARVNAGVTSPAQFFSDDNVAAIFAASGGSNAPGIPKQPVAPTAGAGVEVLGQPLPRS
jgi:hypothetical protein